MTRKDFQMIANIIREMPVDRSTRDGVAVAFAAQLQYTNSRFDKARFFEACGASPACNQIGLEPAA